MKTLTPFKKARFLALASLVALASAGCAPEGGDAGEFEQGTSEDSFEADEARAEATPDEADESDAVAAAASGNAAEVLRLINQARGKARKCGAKQFKAAPALKRSVRLERAAKGHSKDMAARDYFDHTSPEGKTFADRIKAQTYDFSTAGENIAAGQQTPAAAVDAWLKSAGHCKNIMNPAFRHLGVGRAAGGSFGVYWTTDFGAL